MVDPLYALTWPRSLFEWEAKSVMHLPDEDLRNAMALLLQEAYMDPDVAERFYEDTDGTRSPGYVGPAVRGWMTELLQDDDRLLPFTPPRYYAERKKLLGTEPQPPGEIFSSVFVREINDLQEQGYFPRLMPRECVDDRTDYNHVTKSIRNDAMLTSVSWPIAEPDATRLPADAAYTLMEFFHDHAQRPRTYLIHSHANCGRHFHDHNRGAGAAVYRWRMNRLLERYNVPLRLAHKGSERGRLVEHFGLGLDPVANRVAAADEDQPVNEVAEAVRLFRERGASLAQKRAAMNALANALEPRRPAIKQLVMTKDERDLFEMANTYAIRHRNDHQRTDIGPEYVDWVFWNFVLMVDLMTRLERRNA